MEMYVLTLREETPAADPEMETNDEAPYVGSEIASNAEAPDAGSESHPKKEPEIEYLPREVQVIIIQEVLCMSPGSKFSLERVNTFF